MNLYGYTDYNGPKIVQQKKEEELQEGKTINDETNNTTTELQQNYDYDDDDDDDPLRSGLWMEGDSLAPPLGSSITLIHSILEFGNVSSNDILYDLGCGDGRVCLEALVYKNCNHCIGIEVEEDLVLKSNTMISNLPESYTKLKTKTKTTKTCNTNTSSSSSSSSSNNNNIPRIQVLQADLRDVLKELVNRNNNNNNAEKSSSSSSSSSSSPSTTISQQQQQQQNSYNELPMPTVIVLYLLPEAIQELEKDLLSLIDHNNVRIICNTWGLPSRDASNIIDVPEDTNGITSTSLFLYTPTPSPSSS